MSRQSKEDDSLSANAKKKAKKRRRHDDDSSSSEESRKKKRHKKKHKKSKKKHKKQHDDEQVILQNNERLQQKLQARGETLEERNERRGKKRAAHIVSQFGYTPESNPFNDPQLHEKFTWKKAAAKTNATTNAFDEISKVRQRRMDREQEMVERERTKAQESRVREQEHYQDWAQKEEAFHLQQQRQRSAIRLVEGREKPIDVLAKNILMFGLTDHEQTNRARVKYQERYSALHEMESLEVELEESAELLKVLKLEELRELKFDVLDFYRLEKEALIYSRENGGNASDTILKYWDNILILVNNEILQLERKQEGGEKVSSQEVASIFVGQTDAELEKMKLEVIAKLEAPPTEDLDRNYWTMVLDQLTVHLARKELSVLHSRMLVRQLEKLEAKKSELYSSREEREKKPAAKSEETETKVPTNVEPGFGDQEDETAEEVELERKSIDGTVQHYRKPRYFNRVRTGYDWNKYNQTHYDQDNPPPKTVQGYKFNIFYPDLDPSISPRFALEAADTDEFCIIRFTAGPPYQDIAFKIVNREWNRSRKKGFKCTFERGILSLYFNFTTFWYRK